MAVPSKNPSKRKAKKPGGVVETVRFLLMLFLFAIVIRSLIAAPFVIPSGSMLPRMMIGDYLFVSKWSYGYSRYSFPFGLASFDGRILAGEPKRGDVVVFRFPGQDNQDYVKRLIGLPGDTIQMRRGTLVLNGQPVPKLRIADYLMPVTPNSPCRYVGAAAVRPLVVEGEQRLCPYSRFRETLPGGRSYEVLDQTSVAADETQTYEVPAGHYFMMGDNRDDSTDSRFAQGEGGVGFLPADRLVGKALITFFSTDGTAEWIKPWTWFSAARWERVGDTF